LFIVVVIYTKGKFSIITLGGSDKNKIKRKWYKGKRIGGDNKNLRSDYIQTFSPVSLLMVREFHPVHP